MTRLNREDAAALMKKVGLAPLAETQKKRNKYNAQRVQNEHGVFDSKAEYSRWLDLRLMERAREISDLRRQVRFPLVVFGVQVTTYIADFVYFRNGQEVVEDVKGGKATITAAFRIKQRLMKAVHGIDVGVFHG